MRESELLTYDPHIKLFDIFISRAVDFFLNFTQTCKENKTPIDYFKQNHNSRGNRHLQLWTEGWKRNAKHQVMQILQPEYLTFSLVLRFTLFWSTSLRKTVSQLKRFCWTIQKNQNPCQKCSFQITQVTFLNKKVNIFLFALFSKINSFMQKDAFYRLSVLLCCIKSRKISKEVYLKLLKN